MATTVLYPSGAIKTTRGTWTHTAGASAETITVSGVVFGAIISNCDSTGEHDVLIPYSTSGTAGISTITFYANAAVTTGKFIIFHSG